MEEDHVRLHGNQRRQSWIGKNKHSKQVGTEHCGVRQGTPLIPALEWQKQEIRNSRSFLTIKWVQDQPRLQETLSQKSNQ